MTSSTEELLEAYRRSLSRDVSPTYAATAARFLAWAGGRPMDQRTVEEYIDSLRSGSDHYADGSVRFHWGVIRRLFIANGLAWPFKRGDAPVVRQSEEFQPALDPELVADMVRKARTMAPRYSCFLAVSTVYGVRVGEMALMTPGSLKPASGSYPALLYVETEKHGRQRYHVVPEHVYPWIAGWGFRMTRSLGALNTYFDEMKTAIGIGGTVWSGVSWHSIRRSLAKSLDNARLPSNVITSFMRWKAGGMGGAGGSNMASRYAGSQTVGREGPRATLTLSDEDVDRQVFAVHPFLDLWK